MNFKSPRNILWIISIIVGGIACIQKFFPNNFNLPVVNGKEFEVLLAGFIVLIAGSILKK